LPSGEFESGDLRSPSVERRRESQIPIVRLFLHRRDLFCAFLDLAKNALPIPGKKQNPTKAAATYGGYSHNPTEIPMLTGKMIYVLSPGSGIPTVVR
jgi:hypothetical protein